MLNFVEKGNELPVTSFEALSSLIKNQYEKYQDQILEILKFTTKNQQELPELFN
jgi:hypothetical protein